MASDTTVETEDKHEHPFLFETFFDTEQAAKSAAEAEPETPPEPTFSAAQLEDARQAGYQAGHKEALLEASSNIQREILQLLEHIGGQFSALAEAHSLANQQMLRDGADVAVTIMRKVMPAIVAKHGSAEIDALITDCLKHLIGHPRITVRVSPQHVAEIQSRLDTLVADCGFEGRFLVEGDAALEPADCRLEWPGGGAERRMAQVWHEIDELLRQFRGDLTEESEIRVGETGASA